jgi:hypothetical protein
MPMEARFGSVRNCITFVLYAKYKLGGKIIIHSWSGAWRKREWPKLPHFALRLKDGKIIHYQAKETNLPLHKMLDFDGTVEFIKKRKRQ